MTKTEKHVTEKGITQEKINTNIYQRKTQGK